MSLVGFTRIAEYELPVITGSHNDFVVLLRYADFTTTALSKLDDGGGDLRFSSDAAGSNQIPCEVVVFDKVSELIEVWFKVPVAQTYELLHVWGDNSGALQPTFTDTFGRNAVWYNFLAVYHCYDNNYTDSAGNYDLTLTGTAPPIITAPNGTNSYDFTGLSTLLKANITPISSYPFSVFSNHFITNDREEYAAGFADTSGGGRDFSIGTYVSGSRITANVITPVNLANTGYMTPLGGSGVNIEAHMSATWESDSVLTYGGRVSNRHDYFNAVRTLTGNYEQIGLGGRIDTSPTPGNIITSEVRFSNTLTHNADRDTAEYSNQSVIGAWGVMTDVVGGGNIDLLFNDSTLGLTSEQITLQKIVDLLFNDSTFGLKSDTITLQRIIDLIFNNSTFSMNSDSITIQRITNIIYNDSTFGLTSDEIVLQRVVDLLFNGSTFGLISDSITLSTHVFLEFINSTFGLKSEKLDLQRFTNLEFVDSTFNLQSQDIILTRTTNVQFNNSTFGLTSDMITLITEVMPDLNNENALLMNGTIHYKFENNTPHYKLTKG